MIKGHKIPKLSLTLIGHMLLAGVIGWFSFVFLYSISSMLVTKFEEGRYYGQLNAIDRELFYFIEMSCFIAAVFVFFVVLLYLIGQKFSYILEINHAIQQLEGGNLGCRVEVKGEDEIAELAQSLNNMAYSLEGYLQNEEKLVEERIALTKSLSHDIRTPLTAIISYTEFIKQHKYDDLEKLESYITIIQSKAYQIKEITALLLDYNQEREVATGKAVCDGNVLIQQLIQEYQEVLEDEGFNTIQMEWESKAFQTSLEPQDVIRIFENIVSNIIKYADPTKSVVFRVQLDKVFLSISQSNSIRKVECAQVESHGIGIKNIRQLANKNRGEVDSSILENVYNIKVKLHI